MEVGGERKATPLHEFKQRASTANTNKTTQYVYRYVYAHIDGYV